jgi:lipid-A-disaccharide synthase
MKLCIDKMLCILPFEKDYYRNKWNWDVEYVGHPLVEVIEKKKSEVRSRESEVNSNNNSKLQTPNSRLQTPNSRLIALLPGSRKQEISKKLPIMLAVAKSFPDYHFVVAQAPGLENDFYQPFLAPYQNVSSVNNRTYDLLSEAKAALDEQRFMAEHMPNTSLVEIDSAYGHDGFIIETKQITEYLGKWQND